MSRIILGLVAILANAACVLAQSPPAWKATGEGFVLDSTHPVRPGDTRSFDVRIRLTLDETTGEGEIALADKDDAKSPPDLWYWRRGRLFQSNDSEQDLPPKGCVDLSPAAIAVLHPGLLAAYLRERPENTDAPTGPAGDNTPRFVAVGDVLWRVEPGPQAGGASSGIGSLSRTVHDDVQGTLLERIRYEGRTVTVTRATPLDHGPARVIAKFEFDEPRPEAKYRTPKGDPDRDAAMVVPPEEFTFRDLGGGLFACELARANARVFVVEFDDGLLVFEGVFSSRNAETLAAAVRERFRKPATHFAFSHIHPQYLAGVRAWASEGVTVLVPPTSAKAVADTLAASFNLRPDAWSRKPGEPRIEAVAERWTREDASASVVVINNPKSDHTDEFFIVYMPRTKTLLTGDLLFYRPGQPLRSRSLTLARYVKEIGLEIDRCVTTWPLQWVGKNELSGEELRAAAQAGEEAEAASPPKP